METKVSQREREREREVTSDSYGFRSYSLSICNIITAGELLISDILTILEGVILRSHDIHMLSP